MYTFFDALYAGTPGAQRDPMQSTAAERARREQAFYDRFGGEKSALKIGLGPVTVMVSVIAGVVTSVLLHVVH